MEKEMTAKKMNPIISSVPIFFYSEAKCKYCRALVEKELDEIVSFAFKLKRLLIKIFIIRNILDVCSHESAHCFTHQLNNNKTFSFSLHHCCT